MFAVVRLGNQQFKVQAGDFVRAPFQNHSPEDKIELPVVAFISEKAFALGPSQLKGSKVKALVLRQSLSKKALVFKKKRRKGYRKTRGHRQKITELKILELKSPDGEISKVEWKGKPKTSAGEKKADKTPPDNLKKKNLTNSSKASSDKLKKENLTSSSSKASPDNLKKKSLTGSSKALPDKAKKEGQAEKITKREVLVKKAEKQAVGKTKSKKPDIKKAGRAQDKKNKNLKSAKKGKKEL